MNARLEVQRIRDHGDFDVDSSGGFRGRLDRLAELMREDLDKSAARLNERVRTISRNATDRANRAIEAALRHLDKKAEVDELYERAAAEAARHNRLRTLWEKAGIRNHLPMLRFGGYLAPLLLAVLAVVDVAIFAEAASVFLGAARSLTDPLYLTGGAVGGLVFVLGLILGRKWKEWVLGTAKRKAIDQLDEESTRGDQRDRGEAISAGEVADLKRDSRELNFWHQMGYLLLLFTSFVSAGFLVRLRGSDEEPLMSVLLGLVPLVVTLIEFYAYDPLQLVRVSRSLRRQHKTIGDEVRAAAAEAARAVANGLKEIADAHAAAADELTGLRSEWDAAGKYLEAEIRAAGEAVEARGLTWRTAQSTIDLVALSGLLEAMPRWSG